MFKHYWSLDIGLIHLPELKPAISRITTIEQLLFDTESNLLEKVYQVKGGRVV